MSEKTFSGQLDFGHLWCDAHWKPIQDSGDFPRPISGILACLFLFEALVTDDRFLELMGGDAETGKPGDPSLLGASLAKIAPVCCWVSDEALTRVYREASGDLEQKEPLQ